VIKWKVERRFAATRARLEHACEKQDLESCYVLARALEDGSLGTTDHERAAALNSVTCQGPQYMPSCNALGYMLVRGHGVEKDPLKGARLFYEACTRDYGPACDSMGEAIEKGWCAPASSEQALPFYDRGCTLGEEVACESAKRFAGGGSRGTQGELIRWGGNGVATRARQ
jgi:TPR repeat protein